MIIMFFCSAYVLNASPDDIQQAFLVKGRVVDTLNEGIPGANIMIKGTTTGTITDFDGNYAIEVPGKQSVLVFSFIRLYHKGSTG